MRKLALAVVTLTSLVGCAADDRPEARYPDDATCAVLRERWQAALDDPDTSRLAQAEYRDFGCYERCGHLSDTASRCATAPTAAAPEQPPVTAPPFPSSLVGFAPDGPPQTTSVRAFTHDEGSLVHDFPLTMNGCGNGRSTTRWRSLGGPVTAGITDFVDEGTVVRRTAVEDVTTGLAGLLVTDNQCQQPVFFAEGAGMVDVAVEYLAWRAAP